ncbi:MAG: phage tail tape measure protein [Porticoccaceae bacterium]
MKNLSVGILIGAAVSGQFTSTTKHVNTQLKMIGEEAAKLSQRRSRVNLLGNAESDLEKARAKAAAASRAVMALRQELSSGPPRKDWSRDFEAAKAASERAAAGVERARQRVTQADAAFRAAGGAAGGYAANMRQIGDEVDRVQAKHARLSQYLEAKNKLGEWASSARSSLIGATAGVAAVSAAFIRPAAAFEDSMLGIAKQVEGARDENGQLTQVYHDMRHEVQMLGREMPIAMSGIAEMFAGGARMGIAREELKGYAQQVGMMAEAFELPYGPLAEQMGKISGLYKRPITAMDGLADAINYLDDNAISKGGDIIGFLTRTGGVAGSVAITDLSMAALGSTLLTLGESQETASTATNAMLQKFGAAVSGSKKMQAALEDIGLSAAEVQKGMQQDAIGTIMKVMEATSQLPADQQLGVMVGLVGLEHSDTLAKLANGTDEFRRQLELAHSEAAKGSMLREYEARLGTFSAQWEIFKNRIGELAINIGTVLLPIVNKLFTALGSVLIPMADFAAKNQAAIKTIAGMAAGFLAWKVAIAPVIGLLGNIKTIWTVVSLALTANPIGIIIMGLALAAGAIMANWDTVGPWFTAMWDGIARAGKSAWDAVVSVWNMGASFIGGIWSEIEAAVDGGIVGVGALLLNWSPLGLVYQAISAGLSQLGVELPGKFTELGSMMMQGMVNGIRSMGAAVKDSIVGMGDSAMGWFKEKLGIQSPSRVFTGLGRSVGEGAAVGIGDMIGAVGRAAAGLGTAATMAFQPALAAPYDIAQAASPASAILDNAASLVSGSQQAGSAAAGMVVGRGGQGAAQTVTITNNFHITQLPGESAETLAQRVSDLLRRENGLAQRAALGDWA